MSDKKDDFLRMPVWYPVLAGHTFLTSFVRLNPAAVAALVAGRTRAKEDKAVAAAIEDLRLPMSAIPGNCFTCVDLCAPTDTERFEKKRGAVYSPESAWRFLAESEKVRRSARKGEVEYICLRPFRRMNRMREFRLFLRDGELAAMSQYHLSCHFFRLEREKKDFYKAAKKFVEHIAWLLPVKKLVMDIYFTSDGQILILDLNPWGEPTDPLLLNTWERDWEKPTGELTTMPAPTKIFGDVSVSF